jgi:hypothetical protein
MPIKPRKLKVVNVEPVNINETEVSVQIDTEQKPPNDEPPEQPQAIETKEQEPAIIKEEPTVPINEFMDDVNTIMKVKVKKDPVMGTCDMCGKTMQLKTLKYSHKKLCAVLNESKEEQSKPIPLEIEEPSVPEVVKLVPSIPTQQIVTKLQQPPTLPIRTFEDLRKERQTKRAQRMQRLIFSAI